MKRWKIYQGVQDIECKLSQFKLQEFTFNNKQVGTDSLFKLMMDSPSYTEESLGLWACELNIWTAGWLTDLDKSELAGCITQLLMLVCVKIRNRANILPPTKSINITADRRLPRRTLVSSLRGFVSYNTCVSNFWAAPSKHSTAAATAAALAAVSWFGETNLTSVIFYIY